MAASWTPSEVIIVTGASTKARAGAAGIEPGESLYRDQFGVWQIADPDDFDTSLVRGVALSDPTGADHYLSVALPGAVIDYGSSATGIATGNFFFLGDDGGLDAWTDLASGQYSTFIGVGTTTQRVRLFLHGTGSVK